MTYVPARPLEPNVHDQQIDLLLVKPSYQIQSILRQNYKDVKLMAKETKDMDSQCRELKAFAEVLQEKQGKPLQKWQEENAGAMKALVEQNQTYRKEKIEAQDERREKEVEVEEEHAKVG